MGLVLFHVWRGTSHHAEELRRRCSCASLVPPGMTWACFCDGHSDVFVCVSMCWYVLVCVSMCCLRCVVGCVSVCVNALQLCGGDGSKKKKICNSIKMSHERNYHPYGFNQFEKILKTALNYSHYRFNQFEKRLILHRAFL